MTAGDHFMFLVSVVGISASLESGVRPVCSESDRLECGGGSPPSPVSGRGGDRPRRVALWRISFLDSNLDHKGDERRRRGKSRSVRRSGREGTVVVVPDFLIALAAEKK